MELKTTNVDGSTSEACVELDEALAWEAQGLANARADVAAGRMVDASNVRAWIDSLRTDNLLPVPFSPR